MKFRKLLSLLLCALLAVGSLTVMAAAAEEQPVYLVMGDSIAYGSGLSNPKEAVYGKIVADTNGYDYINVAVPGYTTQNLLRLMQREDVIAGIEKADIISISIGGNNFLLGNLPKLISDVLVKNDVSQFDALAEGFYADLCEIIAGIRAVNPEAAILMQTLYNPRTGYVGEVYQHGSDRINAAVNRFNEEHPGEIAIVDVAARLTDKQADFAGDRIHPSAAGNEKIAVAVLEKLAELGLGDSTVPVIRTPGRDIYRNTASIDSMEIFAKLLHFFSFIYGLFAGIKSR